MAYARFGWEGSDVYVFLSVGGYFDCCGCNMEETTFKTTDEIIAHLEAHRAAGDTVPQDCIDRLREEQEENDEWIRNYDPQRERNQQMARNERIAAIWKIAKEEFGYTHPGPELFDGKKHQEVWEKSCTLYELRRGHD